MKWSCLVNLLTSVSILMPMSVSAETGIDVREKTTANYSRIKRTGVSQVKLLRQTSTPRAATEIKRRAEPVRNRRVVSVPTGVQKYVAPSRSKRMVPVSPVVGNRTEKNRIRSFIRPAVKDQKREIPARSSRRVMVPAVIQKQVISTRRTRPIIRVAANDQKPLAPVRNRRAISIPSVVQKQLTLPRRPHRSGRQAPQVQNVNLEVMRELLTFMKSQSAKMSDQNDKIKGLEAMLGTSIKDFTEFLRQVLANGGVKPLNTAPTGTSIAPVVTPIEPSQRVSSKDKPKNAIDPSFHTALPEDAVKVVQNASEKGLTVKDIEEAANFLHFPLTKKDESAYAMLNRLNGASARVADDFFQELEKEEKQTGRKDESKAAQFMQKYDGYVEKLKAFVCAKYKVASIRAIEDAHKQTQANAAKDAKKAKPNGSEKPKSLKELISIQESGKPKSEPANSNTTAAPKKTPGKLKIPDALNKFKPHGPATTAATASTMGGDGSIPTAPPAPPL